MHHERNGGANAELEKPGPWRVGQRGPLHRTPIEDDFADAFERRHAVRGDRRHLALYAVGAVLGMEEGEVGHLRSRQLLQYRRVPRRRGTRLGEQQVSADAGFVHPVANVPGSSGSWPASRTPAQWACVSNRSPSNERSVSSASKASTSPGSSVGVSGRGSEVPGGVPVGSNAPSDGAPPAHPAWDASPAPPRIRRTLRRLVDRRFNSSRLIDDPSISFSQMSGAASIVG